MSPVAEGLAASGAQVTIGHRADNIGDADVVLVSSAVPEQNVELVAARERGIPVRKRAEFLGQLVSEATGIAIGGTAGKTTTTGMLAWILTHAGLDPTFIVGGVIEGLGTNARSGQGPHFLIEADERRAWLQSHTWSTIIRIAIRLWPRSAKPLRISWGWYPRMA
jgi:UDP-N-acetylmuramate--alanine ligase